MCGGTEYSEHEGGEGISIEECVSISSSQKETEKSITHGRQDQDWGHLSHRREISRRLPQDNDGGSTSGLVWGATEGKTGASNKSKASFIILQAFCFSTLPGPRLSIEARNESVAGLDLGRVDRHVDDNMETI